jgi:UDP:flavonoid glycosyltransferase YjiC (YdhE family)
MDQNKKNILISPLNWGLGHASRLIPIIIYLIENNHNLIIAGNGAALELLKQKFPHLKYYLISAPEMYYGNKKAINIKLIWGFVKQLINIPIERYKTKKIVNQNQIDIIITDTRPGIFNKKTTNIYITHQINVYLSKSQCTIGKLLTKLHYWIINKYTYCLVPDISGEKSLTGRLSQTDKLKNVHYIGILSRFADMETGINKSHKKDNDIICILSGPEPQRSILEQKIIASLIESNLRTIIIRGIIGSATKRIIKNIELFDTINDEELLSLIHNSKLIICRSGYSSLMDLAALNKKALIIPTPGQPEQEYLAQRLKEIYDFKTCNQNNLTLNLLFTDYNQSENWFVNHNQGYREFFKNIL